MPVPPEAVFTPGTSPTTPPSGADRCFVFHGNALLVLPDGDCARLPRRAELQPLAATVEQHYLGQHGEIHCYTLKSEAPAALAQDGEWLGLRALFGRLDALDFALAGRAFQILQWDDTHRYCGRCGTPTERQSHERARVCPACKLAHYPRLAPAVMALVRRGDELLLARSPHFPPEMFSALAGFVEPGESLEETLAREVREEVGIEVANLRYFGSQPWPFPHSLMIAFVADYAGGEITPQPGEIEAADWFPIDRLPRLPHWVSIARQLIDATVRDIAGGHAAQAEPSPASSTRS